MTRIVLGYSGGLDTSVAIRWLTETFDAEVVAVTLDLGQGQTLVEVRELALAAGAVRCHVLDVREEFARDFMLPALRAGALGQLGYPIGRILSHSLIVKALVTVARMEGATAIAHGCGEHADDLARFEASARALDPSIRVIAPAGFWTLSHRDPIEYARARNIQGTNPHGTHSTLWGRSVVIPPHELAANVCTLTRAPHACPDEPARLDIEFDEGAPVGANGVHMALVELLESLELVAGAHGVGRFIIDGSPTPALREVCEAPAAVVLHAALAGLEALVADRDFASAKDEIRRSYAELVYQGGWFSESRRTIDRLIAEVLPRLSGSVRLRLEKGACIVESSQSPFAPDDRDPSGDFTARVLDHSVAGSAGS